MKVGDTGENDFLNLAIIREIKNDERLLKGREAGIADVLTTGVHLICIVL